MSGGGVTATSVSQQDDSLGAETLEERSDGGQSADENVMRVQRRLARSAATSGIDAGAATAHSGGGQKLLFAFDFHQRIKRL